MVEVNNPSETVNCEAPAGAKIDKATSAVLVSTNPRDFSLMSTKSAEEPNAFDEESKTKAEVSLQQDQRVITPEANSVEELQVSGISRLTNDDVEPQSKDVPTIAQEKQQAAAAPETWNRVIQASSEDTLDLNVTPQMMDLSVISVHESPIASNEPPKNSTFSPIVDTSIQDSRPTIDVPADTPKSSKSVALRSSTPYTSKSQKIAGIVGFEGGTPKRANTSKALLRKVFSPKRPVEGKKEKLNQTLNKSILKSTRKRSMSVTDAESFMQKRVMFISPKVMGIDAIDEKMMASFFEEKENSVMKQAAGTSRRKRSLSTGTPAKKELPLLRSKMPNFKAIHALQFEKMESIADHAQRKAQRAKQLGTPPNREQDKKTEPSTSNNLEENSQSKKIYVSKIPTRSALVPSTSIENVFRGGHRKLKRSMSANTDEPPVKITAPAPINQVFVPSFSVGITTKKAVAVVSGYPRDNTENSQTKPNGNPFASQGVPQNRSKVDERREKNMSFFKTTTTQRTNRRAQSLDILKGVRLNRRFELQMQFRHNIDQNEKSD